MAKRPKSKPQKSLNLLFKLKVNFQALLLILLGIFLTCVYAAWRVNQIIYLPQETKLLQAGQLNISKPTKIVIPKIGTELKTDLTEIKNGVWQVSENNASYLVTSALPGKKGNVIFYGHNTKRVFGGLKDLKIGDNISVITDDNRMHIYEVYERHVVSPNEIELLYPTDYEVLTVYTCIGILDSQRLVLRALPKQI